MEQDCLNSDDLHRAVTFSQFTRFDYNKGKLVLMSFEKGYEGEVCLVLNGTATVLCEYVDGSKSIHDIAALFAAESGLDNAESLKHCISVFETLLQKQHLEFLN